jgi:hypothetical protein
VFFRVIVKKQNRLISDSSKDLKCKIAVLSKKPEIFADHPEFLKNPERLNQFAQCNFRYNISDYLSHGLPPFGLGLLFQLTRLRTTPFSV